jgi:hypothetical protein
MTMRGRSPKKVLVSPQRKVVAAATALLDTMEGVFDEKSAGKWLREDVGLQWSFLTCLQYLSGKEALSALEALPDGWTERGRTKGDLYAASIFAANAVANVRQNGSMLCASEMAKGMKGKTIEKWLAERVVAR